MQKQGSEHMKFHQNGGLAIQIHCQELKSGFFNILIMGKMQPNHKLKNAENLHL